MVVVNGRAFPVRNPVLKRTIRVEQLGFKKLDDAAWDAIFNDPKEFKKFEKKWDTFILLAYAEKWWQRIPIPFYGRVIKLLLGMNQIHPTMTTELLRTFTVAAWTPAAATGTGTSPDSSSASM
jgi:hypothetical protein